MKCKALRFGLSLVLIFSLTCHGQVIYRSVAASSFTEKEYALLEETAGVNKIIPRQYEKQILIALSYFPELATTHIEFRIKHTYVPLSSRPAWLGVFVKKNERKYIITISDSSIGKLMPILLKQMDFNAQVGVIGHELSHIADFSSMNTFGLLRIGAGNLSEKFLDRFEYRTDSICIAHGLGYQLLSWSLFVRKTLHSENWDGADDINDPVMKRERYMNPSTIRRRIKESKIYNTVY